MIRGFARRARARHLKRYLLAWTLGPIALFVAIDAVVLYRATLRTTAAAHDRLLHATAQQIGDLLRVERDVLGVSVPLALIEALEAAGGNRVYYRVIGFDGQHVAGDTSLVPPTGSPPGTRLSQDYVSSVEGKPVQVAALYQPVETSQGQGVAQVLVGETLEARAASAQALLVDMLARQAALMLIIAVAIWLVVQRALEPLAVLRRELKQRPADSTQPLAARGPSELQPVIDELNSLFQRHHDLLQQQQRLVADASHQLRTPMAVLKTQLQSVLGGDAPVDVVLPEMLRTVNRTTHLANQLLSKARLEQMRSTQSWEPLDMQDIAREAVLEMSPLIAARHIECSLDAAFPLFVHANRWMAGELVRNLLSNAIRHTPVGGTLGIRLEQQALTVWDSGPGVSDDVRAWLFQPFAAASGVVGAGLGLSICLDIARSMHADIALDNRIDGEGRVTGLDAVVRWHGERPEEAQPAGSA